MPNINLTVQDVQWDHGDEVARLVDLALGLRHGSAVQDDIKRQQYLILQSLVKSRSQHRPTDNGVG